MALSDGSVNSFESELTAKAPFVGRKGKSSRAPSTAFSMSSSSMFRNEKLTLLDDQFDKLLAEYSDDEIGELDPNDPDVLGLVDSMGNHTMESNINQESSNRLESIFNEFLSAHTVTPHSKRLIPNLDSKECMDELRSELKEEAKKVLDQYNFVEDEDDRDAPIMMPQEKQYEKWDAESILSTYSNIYNHPGLIRETSKHPRIKLVGKQKMPVLEQESEESDTEQQDQLPRKLYTLNLISFCFYVMY
jgi:protein LTV1